MNVSVVATCNRVNRKLKFVCSELSQFLARCFICRWVHTCLAPDHGPMARNRAVGAACAALAGLFAMRFRAGRNVCFGLFLSLFVDMPNVCPSPLRTERTVTGLLLLCAGCAAQVGGFVDDSQARLEARTVYFNRDFRDGHSNSGFVPSSGHGASARSVPCYQWRPDQGPCSNAEGREWERDTELKYPLQSDTFKDVSVRLRNATYRSIYPRWARDMDESRVIVSYNFSLF